VFFTTQSQVRTLVLFPFALFRILSLVINSMEPSLFGEASSRSAAEEFPNISHIFPHKSPHLVPILSQTNPTHTTPSFHSLDGA
jgi:hypothetical protein